MSIKSALFAAITTVVMILALGNEWVVENGADGDVARETRRSVLGALRFQVWDMHPDFRGSTIARLVLLIVLAGVFGGIVGRARPAAAFLGGWGLFLAASLISAGIQGLLLDDRFTGIPGTDGVDDFTLSATAGAPLGMWLGWAVGLAVLLGSFGKGQPRAATGRPAPPVGAWDQPPPSYGEPAPFGAPAAPHQPGPPPPAPSYGEPAPAPPPPPVIGAPPDRTQVFGEPPRDH